MNKFLFTVLFLSISFFLIGQEVEKPTWKARWKNGAQIYRSDGRFKFQMGGRLQFDVMNIYENSSLAEEYEAQNGAEFRRLRWYTSGTLYGNIKFKVQFDFAHGDAGVKDAYIQIIKIPAVGNFRVGHFKQPFGFEMHTSSKYVSFMERGLTNVFTPERDLGFMIFNNHLKKRLSWFLGYFYPVDNVGFYIGDQYRWTARLTGLPVYKPDGRYTLLHIGAAYAGQYHNNEEFKLTQRPEAHLAPKYLNLKVDAVNTVNAFAGELVFVTGQFTLQGEYIMAQVNPSEISVAQYSRYNYSAYYGSFSWFITGEHKNYKFSTSCFDRVATKKNVGKSKGAGAWELTLRYSYADLNDKDLNGGSLTDYTVGINWYLNPSTRFMFNYVHSDVLDFGYADIVMVRFQIEF